MVNPSISPLLPVPIFTALLPRQPVMHREQTHEQYNEEEELFHRHAPHFAVPFRPRHRSPSICRYRRGLCRFIQQERYSLSPLRPNVLHLSMLTAQSCIWIRERLEGDAAGGAGNDGGARVGGLNRGEAECEGAQVVTGGVVRRAVVFNRALQFCHGAMEAVAEPVALQ